MTTVTMTIFLLAYSRRCSNTIRTEAGLPSSDSPEKPLPEFQASLFSWRTIELHDESCRVSLISSRFPALSALQCSATLIMKLIKSNQIKSNIFATQKNRM